MNYLVRRPSTMGNWFLPKNARIVKDTRMSTEESQEYHGTSNSWWYLLRPGFQPGFFPGYCQGPAPAWVRRPGTERWPWWGDANSAAQMFQSSAEKSPQPLYQVQTLATEQTTSCSSEKCQTYPKIVLTMNSWSECSLHEFILDVKRCKFCHVAVWSQFELQCMYVLALAFSI